MSDNDTSNLDESVRVIDADAHLTEPADLWSSRAPVALKSKMPELRTVDGITDWYLDDQVWSGTGGNVINADGAKELGAVQMHPYERIHPSAWSAADRLKSLDAFGIQAQVLYPNGIGFSSNHIAAIDDEPLKTAVLQIYNDFLAEVQHDSGDRLLPQAIVPFWDMDLAVREISRLVDQGIRGFTLSDRPEEMGLPTLDDAYFAPMWDILHESDSVVSFHINSGRQRHDTLARHRQRQSSVTDRMWPSFGKQRGLAIYATLSFLSNARIIVNLCMSDLFDRYPRLKVVSAESGLGWIPFLLESMEYQFDEMVSDPYERQRTKMRPAEYFRQHMYVMFWFERVGPALLTEAVGVDNVMVATDYPHPVCLFPDPVGTFRAALSDVDADTRRRILHDNAAELYRTPV